MSDETSGQKIQTRVGGPLVPGRIIEFEVPAPALPVHETAVCNRCGHAGVIIQNTRCECCKCGYVWIWPHVEMGLD